MVFAAGEAVLADHAEVRNRPQHPLAARGHRNQSCRFHAGLLLVAAVGGHLGQSAQRPAQAEHVHADRLGAQLLLGASDHHLADPLLFVQGLVADLVITAGSIETQVDPTGGFVLVRTRRRTPALGDPLEQVAAPVERRGQAVQGADHSIHQQPDHRTCP